MIEWVNLKRWRARKLNSLILKLLLDSSYLWRGKSIEELSKVNFLDKTEVEGSQFLNEGMAIIIFLEKDSNDSESFFVIFPSCRTIYQFMHDVDLKIVLFSVQTMFARTVHVKMVHVVIEWALSIQVCDFDATEITSL
jgi:hypothetical protein